jgi:hypothetical protein
MPSLSHHYSFCHPCFESMHTHGGCCFTSTLLHWCYEFLVSKWEGLQLFWCFNAWSCTYIFIIQIISSGLIDGINDVLWFELMSCGLELLVLPALVKGNEVFLRIAELMILLFSTMVVWLTFMGGRTYWGAMEYHNLFSEACHGSHGGTPGIEKVFRLVEVGGTFLECFVFL